MLFLYSPPRVCVASTRRAVVSILSTLSIFGAGCVDAAPLGGAGGCFRALVSCCTKRQTRQKNSAGAASSFPAAGRLSTLSILSIFGACLVISSMFGGCPCCLYLSISGAVQFISRGRGCVEALASCCTKGTGRVICQTKGRTLHTGQKNSTGRPPLLHTSGRLPPAARYAAGLTM